jgi:hypothetical protein
LNTGLGRQCHDGTLDIARPADPHFRFTAASLRQPRIAKIGKLSPRMAALQ